MQDLTTGTHYRRPDQRSFASLVQYGMSLKEGLTGFRHTIIIRFRPILRLRFPSDPPNIFYQDKRFS